MISKLYLILLILFTNGVRVLWLLEIWLLLALKELYKGAKVAGT